MTTLAPIDIKEMRGNASQAADLLKAMSNENRLLILCHLGEKEMSVNELNNFKPVEFISAFSKIA